MPRIICRCSGDSEASRPSAVRAIAEATPPRLAVARDRQRAAVAPLPRGPQSVREERQRAGLAGHVAHGELDQPRLEPQPRQSCGLDHGTLELHVAHSPEQYLVGGDRAGEFGVIGEPAVHVGSHADRHRPADGQQRVDERLPATGVLAQREQLLELVDDHQHGGVDRRCAETVSCPG